MSSSNDSDGFKIPSLPINRVIPHEDGEQNLTAEEDAEQTSKLDKTTTTQPEDKVSETKNAKQAKSTDEGETHSNIVRQTILIESRILYNN